MEIADRVRRTAVGALAGTPYEVFDVGVTGTGPRRVVRVTIERPGGVTLDDCAAASECISAVLDRDEPFLGPYRLEVESPGVERPLRRPEEFRWALGRLVRVRLADTGPVTGTVTGHLRRATPDTITLTTETGDLEVPLSDVVRARTVLEWGPGKPAPRGRKTA